MKAINGIVQTLDGRRVIAGCGTLPPVDDDKPTMRTSDTRKRAELEHSKQSTANRFAVLNAFVDCSMRNLSRVESATWLVLYRDTRNGIAVTSQADIARRIGASDRAVRSAIGQLAKSGLLVVVRRGGLLQGPSKYRVAGVGKSPS